MPGSGKSYETKQLKQLIGEKNYFEMSFQNNVCADNSARAQTFHRAFGMPQLSQTQTKTNIVRKFKKYKYVFIDEFQLTPDYIYPFLHLIKEECKCIFICCGDFEQWPSIDKPYELDNLYVSKLFDGYVYNISGNKRIADKLFIDALLSKNFDEAKKRCTATDYQYTITFYSNPNVKTSYININKEKYEEFTKTKYKENFKLFKGLPLVCIEAKKKSLLVKGRHYKIVDYDDDKKKYHVAVDPDFHDENNEVIKLSSEKVRQYLELGFAFTSHKTIGLTIKKNYRILDFKPSSKFGNPERTYKTYWYVSLSRTIDPKNIYLEKFADYSDYAECDNYDDYEE